MATDFVGQNITWTITSSDNEQVFVSNWNPGEPWSAFNSNGTPFLPPSPTNLWASPITYAYQFGSSYKNISITAQTASGIPCNQILTDQVYVN